MKMSNWKEIEGARCNDIPPQRGLCCCSRWCAGCMTALLAPGNWSDTALSQGGSQGQTEAL